MKRVLFIDRDGTLINEPPDEQIDSLEKLELFPGVITWLGKIARETSYELVLVSNQDGLGTEKFPEETFKAPHEKLMRWLTQEGIVFKKEHIDRSFPHENKPTRKPGIAMLTEYLNGYYDIKNSFVIGDRITDLTLAKNLGCQGILLQQNKKEQGELAEPCALYTNSWEEIYLFLTKAYRTVSVHRKTNETNIQLDLTLDGTGKSKISTGLEFFNHMLEQLSRHGMVDLYLNVRGDLHVDEHHTIEDTALALGDAFSKALQDKRGLARYGFCLPMDDCLAQVAIDFGGRPWLNWHADFKREKIGDVPTEMFFHFFKSFSDNAKCNLDIRVDGTNEHHKIESIFKAFAKAIHMAVQRNASGILPTTKGML